MTDPLFFTEDASKHFGGLKALDGVNLRVAAGEIHSVIGPNGAGKTTLFNCVTGIHPPSRGRIVFDGRDITGYPARRVTRRGLARTFQNIRLFKEMSALENVMVGRHVRTSAGWFSSIFRLPLYWRNERETVKTAFEKLEFVELRDVADNWARNLSYGDQRRLEIARALASDPTILLLDEPAAGMNPEETGRLMSLIRRIRDEGITVILIEHDMRVVMGISDRITVLDHGEQIAAGTPEEVRANPQVVEAYLGAPDESDAEAPG